MKNGTDLVLVNEDPNGVISLEKAGLYTVKFVNFKENSNGDIHTTTVAVGDIPVPVNKDALLSLIRTVEAMDLTPYTKESVDLLRSALSAAKEAAADENATQKQVDDVYAALENAVNGLEKTEQVGPEVPDTDDNNALPIAAAVLFAMLAVTGCAVYVVRKRRS